MLITPERKVPQRSDASQNDQKSKGYPSRGDADLGNEEELVNFLNRVMERRKENDWN